MSRVKFSTVDAKRAADEGCDMTEGYRISRSTLELLCGAIARAKDEEI